MRFTRSPRCEQQMSPLRFSTGRELAVDMCDDAQFGREQRLADQGHKRSEHVNIVASRNNYDNCDRQTQQVLLILQITVDREQYIEFLCSKLQQRPVFDAGPSSFSYGLDVVARELRAQGSRNTLVKKHAHRRVSVPSPARERPRRSPGLRWEMHQGTRRANVRPRCNR